MAKMAREMEAGMMRVCEGSGQVSNGRVPAAEMSGHCVYTFIIDPVAPMVSVRLASGRRLFCRDALLGGLLGGRVGERGARMGRAGRMHAVRRRMQVQIQYRCW